MSELDNFLDPYDDIAVEIVDSSTPNTDIGLSFSNRELAENICQTMGWESFDLFETQDFEGVEARGDGTECLAYAFIALLRWRVFTVAASRNVGNEMFNTKVATHSEYWYIKLVDTWNKQNPHAPQMQKWIN